MSSPAARSAVMCGRSPYRHSLDDRALINSINLDNLPLAATFWAMLLGTTDWRIPSFGSDLVDPNVKPMSQDSFSGGIEFRVWARQLVLNVTYIHNDLNTTIEDVGQLIDGSEVYVDRQPGRRAS